MEKYENGWKSRLCVKINEIEFGILSFGFNVVYEKFHHIQSELYLNIYLGKYQISIGKMHKNM